MTLAELAEARKRRGLLVAESIAINVCQQMQEGNAIAARLVRYCVDRDEGKPTTTLQVAEQPQCSEEDLEAVREVLRRNIELSGIHREEHGLPEPGRD